GEQPGVALFRTGRGQTADILAKAEIEHAVGFVDHMRTFVERLSGRGCRVSLFIEPDPEQIEASAAIGAAVIELHTGRYALTEGMSRDEELERLIAGATLAAKRGLEVHAGHGLRFDNVAPIAAIPEVVELNIGHFLVGEAVFIGLDAAIREMRRLMDEARAASTAPGA
ncbi:pyridoxine 5'-phosphate synthase, partial [Sphingosinicella sp.]|uniref:pyridoxine 5'-phosphate synthase n=1 Tax=Sphingosinicella sp. TaxID=1917971 RepID=UPI0026079FB5